MKVTNVSPQKVYLSDLRTVRSAQSEGRRGEDRYLGAGASVYVQNTSEVLRSASGGEIRKLVQLRKLTIEDQVVLSAAGGATPSVTLVHNYGFPPAVYVLKQVGATWVDAVGAVDVIHDAAFTQVTVSNATTFQLTFFIRLL